MEFRNTLPSPGAPTNTGIARRWQVASSPGRTLLVALLRGVERPQPVAQSRSGHGALEFRAQQHRGQEAILIEQHVLVEGHVGDANGALVAQRAVVAPDGDFEHRAVAMRVQAAVAVVIANGIGGAEIGHPAGFEQRNQPGLMLARNRDRTRNGERQRAAQADGVVEDRVDAAQEGPAEGRKAVGDQFVQAVAFVDALHVDAAPCRTSKRMMVVGENVQTSRCVKL